MQNLLKSIFISVFPIFALYVAGRYNMEIIQNEPKLGAVGLMIIAISVVVFFIGLFVMPRARTGRFLILYTVTITIGLVLTIVGRTAFESREYVYVSLLIVGWWFYRKAFRFFIL